MACWPDGGRIGGRCHCSKDASCARRPSMPDPWCATTATTGTPSAVDNASTSIRPPREVNSSPMVSASRHGRSSRSTWPISMIERRSVVDVGDQHHRVGPVDVRVFAGQQVGHHLLVRADRVEAVGAGQVLHGNRDAVHAGGADAASDGDARIVTGLGAQPGQMVEDAGLTGIGAADQRNSPDTGDGDRRGSDVMAGGHRSGSGTTSISCASRRRRHSSVS